MQDQYNEFQACGTNWVAITSDSLDNLRKLADRRRYSFPLLSDPDGRVARAYGVLWVNDNYGEHNDPGVFIVRSDKTLDFIGVTSTARGRAPVSDVLSLVRRSWKNSQEMKIAVGREG